MAKLTCTVDGDPASSLECQLEEQENQQHEIKLHAVSIGSAKIHLKWANTDISHSPFSVCVVDASKVGVSGVALEGRVGEPVGFTVNASKGVCGSGQLKVVPRGPSATYTPDVALEEDGETYVVRFMPWEVGPHKVEVEFGGGVVPGTPLSINIVSAPDAKTCSASGKGLKKAISGEKNSFQILSPESGLIERKDLQISVIRAGGKEGEDEMVGEGVGEGGDDEVMIAGGTEAPARIKDNGDGSYSVQYTPPSPGVYQIHVKFYDSHIPGSPFRLEVVPSADATKCKAHGPALHPNSLHIAGNPLDMFVDTKGAGTGDLRVVVTSPDESVKPKVFVASDEGGTYSIKWDAPIHGRYHAHIWWADQYIPGSPFKIKVSPGPNAAMVKAYGPGLASDFVIGRDSSEFTIETKDAGIGTLTVKVHGIKDAFKVKAVPASETEPRTLMASYDPTVPGDYLIDVRWSGVQVPGAPFQITIRDPSKPAAGAIKVKKARAKVAADRDSSGWRGDTEDTPEPTPLTKVQAKRRRGKAAAEGEEGEGEIQLAEEDGTAEDDEYEDAIRQQQLVTLRQRANMSPSRAGAGAAGGKVIVKSSSQTQHTTTRISTSTKQTTASSPEGKTSTGSAGGSGKKKRPKKKF